MEDTLAQLEALPGRAEAYVDGTWRASESGRTQTVLDPATGAQVGSVPAMTAADVDRAVEAAHRAF